MATRAGINPKFEFDRFTREQREVAERFSRYYYLTTSVDEVRIGNSTYRSLLMRPSEDLSTILNVEREIIVLFADYETFEARTLTAYERIYEQFDDGRIDKAVRFLISRDPQIVSKIRHYLEGDPEYPIVIPYTYLQFQSPTDNFILASVRSNYLIRDLFEYQSPLKQDYFFFGREKLLNHVIDVHRAGQNASLFGLRKSGKTSTIYAIQRRARALGCHTVAIDCQDPAVHAKTYSELLFFIANEIRKSFNMKPWSMPFEKRADQVSEQFSELMRQTLANARSDVLIIFDEIENISPKTAASPHWRAGHDTILFWQILRAFFQKIGKYKITFCFVGTNPHLFEMAKINDVDNPVYLFAPTTFLRPLSLEDVKEMCQRLGYFMGLDFDLAIILHVHRRFGGHPFFVRQLCSRIHQLEPLTRPTSVSLNVCKQAESAGAAVVRNYIREILDGLKIFYPEEYELLGYLARGDMERFSSVANAYPEFVEHLMGYGILTLRGGDHEFLFDAVKDALAMEGSEGHISAFESRWGEVSARRNKIEEEIRTVLYHWSSRLSEDEWDAACDKCIPKQIEKVGRIGRRKFFSRSQSPLYLLDLMSLLEFSKFSTDRAEMSSIKRALDTVNKLRVDAHAKVMGDGEYKEWNAAISLLEDIFLPPA